MKRAVVAGGMVIAVAALGAVFANADGTYVGAEKCKMCHKVEYNSWSETKHAQATADAKASTKLKFEAACLTCHATNKDEAMAGVQCEACHGPGSEYKSISVMKDKEKAIAAGLILPTQETCNRCHDGNDHHKKVDLATNPPHKMKNKM
jgi:RecJ-like exonuclease